MRPTLATAQKEEGPGEDPALGLKRRGKRYPALAEEPTAWVAPLESPPGFDPLSVAVWLAGAVVLSLLWLAAQALWRAVAP
jgi:hypothetical protein